MAMNNSSLRRRAITYGEKTLEVARRTKNALEIRTCLVDLGKLKTEVAGKNEITEGTACLDEALSIPHDIALETEEAFLFERLNILRGKTVAVIMRNERVSAPFAEIAEEQKKVLDDNAVS